MADKPVQEGGSTMTVEGLLEVGVGYIGIGCVNRNLEGMNTVFSSVCAEGCIVMPNDDDEIALTPYQMVVIGNWLLERSKDSFSCT